MKRPQPRRFASIREREQYEEMERQRKRFAAVELMPPDKLDAILCDPCKTRDPWVDICGECRGKIDAQT